MQLQDTEFVKDSERIYQIVKEHWEWWNPFSEFLRNHMVPNGELIVERNVKKVANELSKSSSMFNSVEQLNELLVQLAEVDVISLSGNVPTFISCKSGKLEGGHALFALYELDEIARKFGGKYSKKVLVTAKNIGSVYLERAKEMGIEVKCEK